ncbi:MULTISPECIES: hypothetical protein [unclassified Pseudomonas]|uniref:hypothetical protein n=1 Tax=unclassified Pseudomonas TaxID=196821 RepID=UPI000F580929|nr:MULTISPECIES: hypothetical protein [unclassified Pseudomonas]AZF21347.1 hypothetical protein C4J91_2597 [Pseudomonas sp. R3-52-08]AZF32032.1 hypothetical protein C4J89_2557 [Pseudomonas sp. R4-35-07]AZF47699.1 hypothetical protein C4J86_2464 [Pseudomonas sp. R2-7-07]AZF58243.1 hypothetical protein C4J84_2366 [Pseudomonas sp. R11-23-07]
MRSFFAPALAFASLLLTGCITAPNAPSLTLQTTKTPEGYVQCVLPKLEKHGITSTVTQNSRHAKVLLTSKIAADDVLEAYKSQDGTKVFLYERKPLASALKPSRLEQAAQDCQ